jgi:hypothetical protein
VPDLKALQQELGVTIKQRKISKKATAAEAKERILGLLSKIQKIQEQKCLGASNAHSKTGARSLQYLTTFAIDLAKLINIAHEKADLPKDRLRALLSRTEPGEQQALIKIT